MPHLMVHHLQELPMQDNLEPHIIKLHGMEPLNINLNMLDNHQSIILWLIKMLIEDSSTYLLLSKKENQILKQAELDFVKFQIFL